MKHHQDNLHQNQPSEPDPFNDRLRRHLEASLESLDPETLDRLADARRQALAATRANRDFKHPSPLSGFARGSNWLLPAGAMASIAVMVSALGFLINSTPAIIPAMTLDIELLSSSEHLDVYDNLDFYHWLAVNDQAG